MQGFLVQTQGISVLFGGFGLPLDRPRSEAAVGDSCGLHPRSSLADLVDQFQTDAAAGRHLASDVRVVVVSCHPLPTLSSY
jgi:hypothetical protein